MSAGKVAVDFDVLDRLVASAELHVLLEPRSGLDLTDDWWTASVEALHVEAIDYGVDAARIGLVYALRDEIAERSGSCRSLCYAG
jgi:hypothetical protein